MEEPDPTTQVDINSAVDEFTTPNDNASEKQVDEKKVLDGAKLFQETNTTEGKKDVEENKAVDEAKASEETNNDGKDIDESRAIEDIKADEENDADDSKNEEMKKVVEETLEESKNIVEVTLKESKNCKGVIDEAGKKSDAQKICCMENITRIDKKDDAKSLIAEDSKKKLKDEAIVGEEENIGTSKDTNAEDKKNDELKQVDIVVNIVDGNFQAERKEGNKKNSVEEEILGASKNAKWDINEICKDGVDEISAEKNMKITKEKGGAKGMGAEEGIKEAEGKDNENILKDEDVADKAKEAKTVIEEDISTEDVKGTNMPEEESNGKELQNDVDANKVDGRKMEVEEKNSMKYINDGKNTKEVAEIKDEKNNESDMKEASKLDKPKGPTREIKDKNNLEDENEANKVEEKSTTEDLKDESVTSNVSEVGKQSMVEVKETDNVEMMDMEENNNEGKKDVEREEKNENENVVVGMTEAEDVQVQENSKDKEDDQNTVKEKNTNGGSRTKKRSRSRRKIGPNTGARGKIKEPKEEEKKDRVKKPKVAILSSHTLSIERPVRERKSVERLVEVIEKEPERNFVIEKGFGTPLKDISKVAYRLARKKPSDLRMLHQILFGRKGKLADFKNHILQFSGFVWHESDEKQRAKVKERLDKCVKENLLGFCDLLCIPVSKINARKENLISKLLDFLAAPHAASDSLQSEDDEEGPKSRKRRRGAKGSVPKSTDGTAVKSVSKERKKSESTPSSKGKTEDTKDKEEYDDGDSEDEYRKEGNDSEGDEELEQSESEKENESEKEVEKDKDGVYDPDTEMDKKPVETGPEMSGVLKGKAKKKSSSKKTTSVKTHTKATKSDENDDGSEKVFVRKKKNSGPLRKKSTSKSDSISEPKERAASSLEPKEKSASVSVSKGRSTTKSESKGKSISKLDSKEKISTEKSSGEETEPKRSTKSNPSKEELRKTICDILKKVDFNTATFTDILNRLGTHYKADLTSRKASIKLLIQDELTKLADELEDNGDKALSEQEKNHKPKAKKARKAKV